MGKTIIIILLIGVTLYLLYISGYMIVNRKRALMFVGTIRGRKHCKASFSSCTGYIKRVMRFKESRIYSFTLHNELAAGKMTVELLDSKKQTIMELSGDKQKDSIAVNPRERYYLIFRFQEATGSYELEWE